MDRLPNIPTPAYVRWREFRSKVGPILVFGLAVFAVYFVWDSMGFGSTVQGIGEGVRSTVSSPHVGVITEMHVQPYQWVQAGQPLATVMPLDPRSHLDLLQSEMTMARLRLEPSMADQHALDYERLRVEQLRLKQDLAMAKVNLQQAESALARNEKLLAQRLVSQDIYDLSLRDRNVYQAEITEKTSSLKDLEQRLGHLRLVGEPTTPGTNSRSMELIAKLESKMATAESNWNAMTLVAPISGMAHAILRQKGEYVIDGEPLITINAPHSDRIVAYLRQPYPIEAKPGMKVQVMTRTQKRVHFTAEISEVGAQVEVITNSLAFIKTGALVDSGLPIMVKVPENVRVRPGEVVDIIVRARGDGKPPPPLAHLKGPGR